MDGYDVGAAQSFSLVCGMDHGPDDNSALHRGGMGWLAPVGITVPGESFLHRRGSASEAGESEK